MIELLDTSGNQERTPKRADPRGVITFGAYGIDFARQVLHKHGIRLKIAPQALRVLICLIERAPNLVEREHLFGLLWPDDTHVDFNGNLNAIIRDLRELFGDSARNPKYIETELRRGYRFIAPVSVLRHTVEGGQVESVIEPLAAAAQSDFRRAETFWRGSEFRWLSLLGATFFAALLLGGLYRWRQMPVRQAGFLPKITQLTSFSGRAGHASLSPDGSRIAFHWDGNEAGNFDIYAGNLGTEKFVRLTHNHADDLNPAWSPDGRDVAFLRRSADGRCFIYLVSAEGGSERLIREVPTESSLSWSPDGRWLAYTVLYWAAPKASSADFGVYAVSLLSGQVTRLTSPPKTSLGDEDGVFSPIKRRIAFFRSSSTGVNELYVQDLDENMNPMGDARRITFEGQNSRNPAWTADGSKIIFSSLKGGVRSLWQVSLRDGSEPTQVGGEDAHEPVVDPFGKRIVYERISVRDTLQTLPLCGTQACGEGQPRRLAYSREVARNPSWSPDGKRIAFESIERGQVQVWLCDNNGSNPTPLSSFKATVSGTPRWAPDRNELVMDSRVSGHSKIFLLTVPAGSTRQLTSGDWEDSTPSFSRDGKTVYFASNRSGEFQVWKLTLATGVAKQVTRQGGFFAVESADGKKLFYAKGMQRTEIGEVPVDGGEETTAVKHLSYWPDFAVGATGIFYVPAKSERGGVPVCFHRFADGREVKVSTVAGIDLQGMALAPDGRELLLSIRTSAETNLMALSFE